MSTTIMSDQIAHTVTHGWEGTANASQSIEYVDSVESRRNLLTNPSFETGVSGMSTIGATISTATDQQHSGSRSMKFVSGSESWASVSLSDVSMLVPGNSYTFSFWAYVPADLSTDYRINFYYYDAEGTFITGEANATPLRYATDWTRVVAYLNPPAETASITAYVLLAPNVDALPGDVIYVDDMLLETGSEAETYFDGNTLPFPIYGQSAPLLVDGWEESVETRNVVNNIVGGGIDITPYPADLRTGQYVAVFQDEDDAADLVQMHRKPGQFWIIDDERPSISMTYVPNGTITRALDDESREFWLVTIPYQEVGV